MTGAPVGCTGTTGDAAPLQSPAQDAHAGAPAACGSPMPEPASTRASVPVTPGGSVSWSLQQGAASTASASVTEPLQQLRRGPAIAAAIQTWISSASTSPIVGKRLDRTLTFNCEPRASELREVNRQRETEIPIAHGGTISAGSEAAMPGTAIRTCTRSTKSVPALLTHPQAGP